MPRPKTGARFQTAYDLGFREGYPPPDNIANDPELMAAFDEGATDAEDGKPSGAPATTTAEPVAKAEPKKPPAKKPAAKKPAAKKAPPKKAAAAAPATKPAGDGKAPVPQRGRAARAGSYAKTTLGNLPRPTLAARSLGDGGGFAFGLLLYVLGVNFLRYGPRGVTGWFSAKFANKPLTPQEADQAARAPARGEPTAPASPISPAAQLTAPKPPLARSA